jgi:uncharacterized metal-binding protein
MSQAIKGALLSGLVLPGLGQFVLKQYLRGAVIMLAVLASVFFIVVDVVQQAQAVLEQIELQGDAIDITAISNAAASEYVQSGGLAINLLMWFILVCWVVGTVDAYRIGKKKDREREAPG